MCKGLQPFQCERESELPGWGYEVFDPPEFFDTTVKNAPS
jgi:hypothetical protein